VIVGRGPERRRIDDLLAAARGGRAGVLVLRGEAGIGKSALLDYAVGRASDMTRLGVQGVESDGELAFAGLSELLAPVLDAVDDLPEPSAHALRSALALASEPVQPLAVRMALTRLLAGFAEARPLLVTVDDVQWVDEPSVAAVGFALRRLTGDRVAVVATMRGDEASPLVADPFDELVIGGLPDDEARELLATRHRLTPSAESTLVRAAAGSPLALLELPEVVGSTPPADAVGPLPAGPRVVAAFRGRLDRLPEATRLAVGVVAADGAADLGAVLSACAALDLAADALRPAEDAGLLSVVGDRLRLRHPLVRSVAYQALAGSTRRRVHAALADALDQPSRVERRTWHRAAAALGPDDEVAAALDEVAGAANRRGAVATAAHGFARAAELSADDDDRAGRFLASADAWLIAGHLEEALTHLERAAPHAVDPCLRADIAASTGLLEAYRAGPARGVEILVEAADLIEAIDPDRATRLLTYAVNDAVLAADIDLAVALGARAEACGRRAGGLSLVSGTMARVEAGLMAADPAVPALLAPLAELAEELIDSDLRDSEHVYGLVVLADLTLETYDRCERLLDVMVRRARDIGRVFLLAPALAIRADLLFRRGRWTEAHSTAITEARETPLGLPGVWSWLHAVEARVEAGLGLDDEARSHGEAALAAATESGMVAVAAWARASLGFLDLGRDRPQAAIEHLEAVAAAMAAGRVVEPGVLWWAGDLIEAHWRVGDVGAARRHVEHLRDVGERTGRIWARAVAARGAGLLAALPAEADVAFAEARRWHERLDAPFETARTLACWGERRLQFGRGDHEELLSDALGRFEAIGAAPWAERTRRMLGTGAVAAPATLTRQEAQVAAIVGAGATSREASEQLFVSPRTIDFHLQNIYRKLGVRSRTELALRMASERTPPGPTRSRNA
jgi:DNA-binding CsgD family transcriptional regulator/tetratricopeptide (TPR) repeat protein